VVGVADEEHAGLEVFEARACFMRATSGRLVGGEPGCGGEEAVDLVEDDQRAERLRAG
jgi:hypothetical protein